MDPFTIVGLVGAGISIWGQLSGASAQADAQRRNAEMKNMQADELLARQSINEGLISEQYRKQGLHYGYSGLEGGGLAGQLLFKQQADQVNAASRADAQFKAKMLRMGAEQDLTLGSDAKTAGYFNAGGTLLGGLAQAGKMYQLGKQGSSKNLYDNEIENVDNGNW